MTKQTLIESTRNNNLVQMRIDVILSSFSGIKKYEWLLVFLISVQFSTSIVYTNIQTYDSVLTPASGYVDSVDYLAMNRGKPGSGIRGYRVMVPWLTTLVPDLPNSLFVSGRSVSPDFQVAIKFGVVNWFFLLATCLAYYALLRTLQLGFIGAFVSLLFFLGSTTVIRSAGLPMVDTAFYFFFCLALLAAAKESALLLLLVSITGVFAKELVLLVIPLIALMPISWQKRSWLIIAVLPGVVLYLLLRNVVPNSTPEDGYSNLHVLSYFGSQLIAFARPNGWINILLAFGTAWIPAFVALLHLSLPKVLRRWSWLIPIVIVGVLLGAGNLSRSTFSAFVIVFALAGWTMERVVVSKSMIS